MPSPFFRATQTAKFVSNELGIKYVIEPAFGEFLSINNRRAVPSLDPNPLNDEESLVWQEMTKELCDNKTIAAQLFWLVHEFAKLRNFDRDIEICFKLRMPYLVSFYGKTITPEKTLMVLEYVPYGSLAKVMTKRRFSLRYKARLALDIARAMNYLHRNRVVHHDLKPQNVLVASYDPDSLVCGKVSVFNSSRFLVNTVSAARVRSDYTPIYTAPEIHNGKPYNEASDVYSFAFTIWSIWTQKEPYSDIQLSTQTLQLIMNGERLGIPSDIPESFGRLTRDCWVQIQNTVRSLLPSLNVWRRFSVNYPLMIIHSLPWQ